MSHKEPPPEQSSAPEPETYFDPERDLPGPAAAESAVEPLAPGTSSVQGLAVPESWRWDPEFLSRPRDQQIALLEAVEAGLVRIRERPAKERYERHNARFRAGQWDQLGMLASRCARHPHDQRKNITQNTLVRVMVDHFMATLRPHLDLDTVGTEPELQRAVMKAHRRAMTAESLGPHFMA